MWPYSVVSSKCYENQNQEFAHYLDRDSSRDGLIEKIIKQKRSSGLFWTGGAAEKKKTNCHKYAIFWGVFCQLLIVIFFQILI